MKRKNCPYQVIQSETYKIGRVTVVQDKLLIDGREYPYTYVVHKDSVCIVPTYKGQVVVIEQYRHTLDRWLMEFPAGGIDDNESSEAAAKRELLEETGYIAEKLVYLGDYYMNQGISSAKCDLYFAKCQGRGESSRDQTELIHTRLIPVEQFETMIERNEFKLLIGLAGWEKSKKMNLV